MKILVTGGSGYLGTHVRSYFNADDLSRRSGHDVLNTSDVEAAADYDLIIHLAALLNKDPTPPTMFSKPTSGELSTFFKMFERMPRSSSRPQRTFTADSPTIMQRCPKDAGRFTRDNRLSNGQS
jgi:hypothetical protein